MENMTFQPLKPRVVLGVAAHPDDLDFGASATFAKFVAAGSKAYYLILTDGSKGTADKNLSVDELVKKRQAEQRAAGQALGLTDVFFLAYEDAALQVTLELKRDIVRVIRQLKPDVVVTMDPSVLYSAERGFINHPDHRAAGQATLDAVFPLARDHLSFPELAAEGLEPHKVGTLLLTNFDKQNYFVDVSDTIEKKMQALASHISQMHDLERTRGWMRDMAAQAGRHVGAQYAEGFMRIDVDGS
jgi:LmbE family N-acetylglucosaminyl deacetylase